MTISMIAPELKTEIVTVTPEKASEWLKNNLSNRSPSKQTVSMFARDMTEDRWQGLNGEPLIFTGNGFLLDGQHRLLAIVKSGVSVRCLVVRGVSMEAFSTIDSGRSRTSADALKISGKPNSKVLSTTASMVLNYNSGDLSLRTRRSPGEVLKVVEELPGIALSVAYACDPPLNRATSKSNVAFCHYVFSQQSPTKARNFLEEFKTGVSLDQESPAVLLRHRLYSAKERKGGFRLGKGAQLYLIFRAWVAFRDGARLRQLKLPSGVVSPNLIKL